MGFWRWLPWVVSSLVTIQVSAFLGLGKWGNVLLSYHCLSILEQFPTTLNPLTPCSGSGSSEDGQEFPNNAAVVHSAAQLTSIGTNIGLSCLSFPRLISS